ncbi:hypothetical protein HPB51_003957 [Rhipicephalus microplus]|uniref:Uncharacterized protein n=1 Tax=Rhipicephalus microplus TaxID=6941 RepID=A0A9J6D8T0_RHIMP|nr:hypothetical protein HPB51_003957 [Rhipicephalus microplus]
MPALAPYASRIYTPQDKILLTSMSVNRDSRACCLPENNKPLRVSVYAPAANSRKEGHTLTVLHPIVRTKRVEQRQAWKPLNLRPNSSALQLGLRASRLWSASGAGTLLAEVSSGCRDSGDCHPPPPPRPRLGVYPPTLKRTHTVPRNARGRSPIPENDTPSPWAPSGAAAAIAVQPYRIVLST